MREEEEEYFLDLTCLLPSTAPAADGKHLLLLAFIFCKIFLSFLLLFASQK